MNKIYVFETRPDELPYLDELQKQYDLDLSVSSKGLMLAEIPELQAGSGISILGMHSYREPEMQALEKTGVHYLSTRTIGYNHIDLDAAKRHHVHVCNAVYAPNGVAEYTVMMMLLCLRGYKQALWRMQVNDFSLDGLMGRELRDLTVGIIGTGRIGTQVAQDLSGFGCRIIGFDLHPNDRFRQYGTYVPEEQLFKESDIITLHVALTDDTYHMINAETISKMKKGVILINCARGALMSIQDLIHGIETEQIGALGLDTVEEEEAIVHRDLKTDIFSDRDLAYIKQFKNVVYTQHMAFYTDAAVRSMVESGIKGLLKMENGEAFSGRLC